MADYGDFDDEDSQVYIEKCTQCGKTHVISAQSDDCPEYYTDIFYRCDCGASIKFTLPVN